MSAFKKSLFLLSLLLVYNCEEEVLSFDNTLDPENPEYIPPQITVTSGPSENEIVKSSVVSFSWEGNQGGMLYQYKFDDLISPWAEETGASFDFLDEGLHLFSVQSKYTTGDTSVVILVNFEVDAVEGPALLFYPRRHIASVGNDITFQIFAEEVQNLTGIEFSISFNPSLIQITSIGEGQFLSNSGESIFHSEYDNEGGSLSVIAAVLGGEESVNGTGDLASIQIEVLSQGTATLAFDGSQIFKDPDNNVITIQDAIDGLVQIQ